MSAITPQLKAPGPRRKRGRKSITIPADPTRTEVTDSRRTYSQLLLNAFNSCDARKLYRAFATYCTPDFYSELKYDGESNPYASKVIATKGLEQHMMLWTSLFKSVPDFLFEGEFQEAYISKVSKDKRCVVRSKFIMNGTRVLDLKIARRVNAQVIKRKLQNKSDYSTSENELMAQIHKQLAESYNQAAAGEEHGPDAGTGAGEGTDWGTTDSADAADGKDVEFDDRALLAEYGLLGDGAEDTHATIPQTDCLFGGPAGDGDVGGGEVVNTGLGAGGAGGAGDGDDRGDGDGEQDDDIEVETVVQEVVENFFEGDVRRLFDKESTVYPDSKPLPRSMRISIAGVFTVYVNPDSGKIDEMQLLYTAVDSAAGIEGDELTGI